MRLLLDACTFLWLVTDDSKLSTAARGNCADPANTVDLSAPSDGIRSSLGTQLALISCAR